MFCYKKKYCILLIVFILIIGLFKLNVNAEANINNKQNNKRIADDIHGIVVDSNGRIYLGNHDKHEIDVYGNDLKYLYSLPCNTYGDFYIDIDNNDNIMIGVTREQVLLIYDKNGELITTKKDPEAYERIGEKNEEEFKDKNGNIYRIKAFTFFVRNRIVKTSNNGVETTIMSISQDQYVNKVVKSILFFGAFIVTFSIMFYIIFRKRRI